MNNLKTLLLLCTLWLFYGQINAHNYRYGVGVGTNVHSVYPIDFENILHYNVHFTYRILKGKYLGIHLQKNADGIFKTFENGVLIFNDFGSSVFFRNKFNFASIDYYIDFGVGFYKYQGAKENTKFHSFNIRNEYKTQTYESGFLELRNIAPVLSYNNLSLNLNMDMRYFFTKTDFETDGFDVHSVPNTRNFALYIGVSALLLI